MPLTNKQLASIHKGIADSLAAALKAMKQQAPILRKRLLAKPDGKKKTKPTPIKDPKVRKEFAKRTAGGTLAARIVSLEKWLKRAEKLAGFLEKTDRVHGDLKKVRQYLEMLKGVRDLPAVITIHRRLARQYGG
jgi:hypothetical protein